MTHYNTRWLYLFEVQSGRTPKEYQNYYTFAATEKIAELKTCIFLSGGGWIQTYAEAKRVLSVPKNITRHKNFIPDLDNLLSQHPEWHHTLTQ